MLVTLNHNARSYSLKEIFSKEWFWLGWSKLSHSRLTIVLARLVLNEFSLSCLHAVRNHEA